MSEATRIIKIGKVGAGASIHYIDGRETLCGAGFCSTGFRRNTKVTLIKGREITCKKCAALIAKYEEKGYSIEK